MKGFNIKSVNNQVINKVYTVDINENEVLLKGTVIDQSNKPVKDAVVLISKCICSSYYYGRSIDIGYVLTKVDGTFCVVLNKSKEYIITIYNPMVYPS